MKPYLLICCVGFFFFACKKDEASKKDLITKAPWVYESGGIDLGNDGNVDFTFESAGVPPACLLDNKGTFNADGSGINDEGTTKCVTSAPQTSPFTWAFVNNETELNISGSGFAGITGTLKLKTLTDAKMSLSKDTMVSGFSATILLNLKH